jgi:hypothetical protein
MAKYLRSRFMAIIALISALSLVLAASILEHAFLLEGNSPASISLFDVCLFNAERKKNMTGIIKFLHQAQRIDEDDDDNEKEISLGYLISIHSICVG